VPTDPAIWITAAKLEEAQGNNDMVAKIISRALKSLQSFGVVISRDAWLKEAEAAERVQPSAVLTCRWVCLCLESCVCVWGGTDDWCTAYSLLPVWRD
jgi:pre-mRNA-processing factor 6